MNELRRWPFGAVAPLLAITCSDANGPGVSFELAEARWAAGRRAGRPVERSSNG